MAQNPASWHCWSSSVFVFLPKTGLITQVSERSPGCRIPATNGRCVLSCPGWIIYRVLSEDDALTKKNWDVVSRIWLINCLVCGQLKPGMTTFPGDACILQRLIRACVKKLSVHEELAIYQARWQPDITQGAANRENSTLLLLSLWRKGRHERAQSRYESRWRFYCC